MMTRSGRTSSDNHGQVKCLHRACPPYGRVPGDLPAGTCTPLFVAVTVQISVPCPNPYTVVAVLLSKIHVVLSSDTKRPALAVTDHSAPTRDASVSSRVNVLFSGAQIVYASCVSLTVIFCSGHNNSGHCTVSALEAGCCSPDPGQTGAKEDYEEHCHKYQYS